MLTCKHVILLYFYCGMLEALALCHLIDNNTLKIWAEFSAVCYLTDLHYLIVYHFFFHCTVSLQSSKSVY